MASFGTDDDALLIYVELDSEHPDVDLTQDRLGDDVLDDAADEIEQAWRSERSPSGEHWAPLRPSTVRQKPGLTASAIGVRTGAMLDPSRIQSGPRDVQPRLATLGYKHDGRGSRSWGKAHGFHNGQARTGQTARPLMGWSDRAQDRARDRIREADDRARFAADE